MAAAAPQWLPYHSFPADEPLAAGRRIRLFAGEEDAFAPAPPTGELRRFQGFASADPAGRRLPAEGVDLRLVSPDGEVVHARRFVPDAAYGAAGGLVMLRAADGTGVVLVRPDTAAPAGSRLSAGQYRLAWTYRRDNSAVDPASPVLREAGDASPEVVALDLPVR